MKHKFLGFLYIIAFAAAAVSFAVYWETAHQPIPDLPSFPHPIETEAYHNDQYGFEINYAKADTLATNGTAENFFKNSATTLASIALPQTAYPKTNFGSARVTIAVQDASSQSACEKAKPTTAINGVAFHQSETGDAAAGTLYDTQIYRAFHDGRCYELSATVGLAHIENFDPGTVTEVTVADVQPKLNAILQTFKFSN